MTKKALFLSLLLAAGLPALAQIQKGNVMLGGSVSGSWSRRQSTLSTVFPASTWEASVSPNVGYFVRKGLAVGAVTSYGASRSRANGLHVLANGTPFENTTRSYHFTLGPALHYFVMLGDKLGFYAHSSVAWGKQSTQFTVPITGGGVNAVITHTDNVRYRTIAAGPGLAFFLNPHVALLGGLSYRNQSEKGRREADFTVTNNTSGLYLNLGAQVFLGR